MYDVLFTLPWGDDPWSLHTYGVLIATGFLVGLTLAKRQAAREGEDPERVVDMAFYMLLFGLLGARVVFILTKFDDYVRDPLAVVMFWRGGLVWYGGFITAALYVFYHCRKNRLNYWKYADLLVPYVALAHAFGRLGCLAAGCCFGKPTDMAWGVHFPVNSMVHQAQQSEGHIGLGDAPLPVHPTQLYESGAEMALFWLLIMMRPYKRFHGQLMLMWLSIYPVVRSVIEVFRGDRERGIYIISTSQWISVAVAGFAAWLYWFLRRERLSHAQPRPAQASS